jgi:hypothetical protein
MVNLSTTFFFFTRKERKEKEETDGYGIRWLWYLVNRISCQQDATTRSCCQDIISRRVSSNDMNDPVLVRTYRTNLSYYTEVSSPHQNIKY